MSDAPRPSPKGLLREPAVQFVILGVVLFGGWRLAGGAARTDAERITVSAARVDQLAASFRMTWQRPPTRQELDGLVREFVKEEVYYREALALGFDRDDEVVRRRLRQKIELLTVDVAEAVEPTRAELQAFLDAHPDRFRLEPSLSFRHIYFSGDRRGAAAEEDARRALERHGEAVVAGAVGDPFVLPEAFESLTPTQVSGYFGTRFADALLELEPGAWRGPIQSGYGYHLVRIDARTEGRLPALDEVRGTVRRELLVERRREADRALFEGLQERYDIRIEWPEGMETPDTLTGGR